MNFDFIVWRPVVAGLDSLTNIENHWSIDDLMDAHEMLDVKEEVETYAIEQARRH